MRGSSGFILTITFLAVLSAPGWTQTPTERLDALLKSWRGQSVEHLREVWGRAQATEMNGDKLVLVYEKRQKIKATLGGINVRPGGVPRCVVKFEINTTDEVARTARQGSAADCWSVWRGLDP